LSSPTTITLGASHSRNVLVSSARLVDDHHVEGVRPRWDRGENLLDRHDPGRDRLLRDCHRLARGLAIPLGMLAGALADIGDVVAVRLQRLHLLRRHPGEA
jgi:hypothetical protein